MVCNESLVEGHFHVVVDVAAMDDFNPNGVCFVFNCHDIQPRISFEYMKMAESPHCEQMGIQPFVIGHIVIVAIGNFHGDVEVLVVLYSITAEEHGVEFRAFGCFLNLEDEIVAQAIVVVEIGGEKFLIVGVGKCEHFHLEVAGKVVGFFFVQKEREETIPAFLVVRDSFFVGIGCVFVEEANPLEVFAFLCENRGQTVGFEQAETLCQPFVCQHFMPCFVGVPMKTQVESCEDEVVHRRAVFPVFSELKNCSAPTQSDTKSCNHDSIARLDDLLVDAVLQSDEDGG